MRKQVYWIEGDGVGTECWLAARPILDKAVEIACPGESIEWVELLAGEKALRQTGSLLPKATAAALKNATAAIKGPLSTPVGTGFRSLNVTLRQVLDLYACIRPVKYFPGIESPLKHPEQVDMVVFRENTEDVYAGIEFEAKSHEAKKLISFLHDELGISVDKNAAIGIKPMTEKGSKRLIRRAINFALDNKRTSLTLMHKGNIMKFTEGGFRKWGYEVAEEEFANESISEAKIKKGAVANGRLIIKDRIADAMFQEVLLKPAEFSVIAAPNLNGDYISDALAAEVGGLGLAPGANMSDTLGFFEATHGTAPDIAGKDMANPGSLILSGAMLLDYLGWPEAAKKVRLAMEKAIKNKRLTSDLARQIPGASIVGCKEFGDIVGEYIN